MMLYAGLDPGASGAIVVLDQDGRLVSAISHENNETLIADCLRGLEGKIGLAVLELVSSQAHDGHVGAFSLGEAYGCLRMGLVAFRIPFVRVVPAGWQASAGIVKPAPRSMDAFAGRKRKDGSDPTPEQAAEYAKRQNKKALKRAIVEHAMARWPTLPIRTQDHWDIADAACMADHARKAHLGMVIAKPTRNRKPKGMDELPAAKAG